MFKDTKAFSSFSAPDLDAIKGFYREKLGVEVTERPEGVELHLGGGGLPVLIYHSQEYTAPEHTVLNFLVDDVEKAVDELATRGVVMEQYPDFGTDEKGISRDMGKGDSFGPKAIAWFKDPAEHIIAIIQEK